MNKAMMNLLRVMPLIVIAAALLPGASAARALAADSPMPQAATKPSTEEILVTASGFGSDPSSAKLDATREAIRQAVGTFIDVKSVVDGDQLVSDRILSATSALVIGSKVVAGPTRRGDGTYEVKCEVRIRRQILVGALADAGFKVTGVMDGDAAKRVSEVNFANAKEAEEILKDRLSNLWSKLMIGRLLDDRGVPLGDGEIPTVVQRDDGTVVICANVQLYFHLEAFYTKFVPDMKRLLEALALSKSEFTWNRAATVNSPRPGSRFAGVPVFGDDSGLRPVSSEQTRRTIWIPDGRDQLGLNEHFAVFEVPAAVTAPFVQAAEQCAAAGFLIELLNGEGQVVAGSTWAVRGLECLMRCDGTRCNCRLQTPAPIEQVEGVAVQRWLLHDVNRMASSRNLFLVSPRFGIWSYDYAGFPDRLNEVTCDVIETRVHITLPAGDLGQVKRYRVVPVEGAPWR
jgi:hypothetical protein